MTCNVQSADICFSSVDEPSSGAHPVRSGGLDEVILARPTLIVEDEAIIAWTLESLLEDLGFKQVAIASSGADAVEQARRTTPGLILSDINLGAGGMDGVAAVAAIVARFDAAVVFITGFASDDARRRIARDVPGAVLLRKPFGGADLCRAIEAVAERGSAH